MEMPIYDVLVNNEIVYRNIPEHSLQMWMEKAQKQAPNAKVVGQVKMLYLT
jgi:hypothetical protein